MSNVGVIGCIPVAELDTPTDGSVVVNCAVCEIPIWHHVENTERIRAMHPEDELQLWCYHCINNHEGENNEQVCAMCARDGSDAGPLLPLSIFTSAPQAGKGVFCFPCLDKLFSGKPL
jgi:hypothetical protein